MSDTATITLDTSAVALRPIQDGDYALVSAWLAEERNARWLDFGGGTRSPDALALKLMAARAQHRIWIYGPADASDVAVGIVALGNINPRHRTAETWCVLGRKDYGTKDLTTPAAAQLVRYGFEELDLHVLYAWTVEVNRGARRILERLGFREFGRQRECHRLEGRVYDRVWYDLLSPEFKGYNLEWQR